LLTDKVKELMERPLGELKLCAILIDGTPFRDRQMIVALGIGCDGTKTVLGIREGATENLAVTDCERSCGRRENHTAAATQFTSWRPASSEVTGIRGG
jgi:hypothetical protein